MADLALVRELSAAKLCDTDGDVVNGVILEDHDTGPMENSCKVISVQGGNRREYAISWLYANSP